MATNCTRCALPLADHDAVPGFGIIGPQGQWCEVWPPAWLARALRRVGVA